MTAFPAGVRYLGGEEPSRPCDRCGKACEGRAHTYGGIANLQWPRLLVCPGCHREFRARVRVHKHGKERGRR